MARRARARFVMVVFGICSIALMAAPVAAEKDPGKHLDMLDKKLELTDEQRSQVEGIMAEYRGRFESLKEQMEALRTEKQGKIKAVLTPEQQATYDKMQDKKKEHHKHWGRKKKDD